MYAVKIIDNIFSFYLALIVLRIFLTWIVSPMGWQKQPLKSLMEVTDLYLNLFRKMIPPISGLDFSPIVAIIVLQVLQIVVTNIVGLALS